MTDRFDRDDARRLRTISEAFENRRSTAGDVAGVISAIPAPVAQALLALGWRVDDAGSWISPRNEQVLPWREALDEEISRAS